MITVHIAAKPGETPGERLIQRCFRCNRVLTDNRRVRAVAENRAGATAGLAWWEPGAFIGITHDTFPIQSMMREVDADPNDPDERACECPSEAEGGRPVAAVYQ